MDSKLFDNLYLYSTNYTPFLDTDLMNNSQTAIRKVRSHFNVSCLTLYLVSYHYTKSCIYHLLEFQLALLQCKFPLHNFTFMYDFDCTECNFREMYLGLEITRFEIHVKKWVFIISLFFSCINLPILPTCKILIKTEKRLHHRNETTSIFDKVSLNTLASNRLEESK